MWYLPNNCICILIFSTVLWIICRLIDGRNSQSSSRYHYTATAMTFNRSSVKNRDASTSLYNAAMAVENVQPQCKRSEKQNHGIDENGREPQVRCRSDYHLKFYRCFAFSIPPPPSRPRRRGLRRRCRRRLRRLRRCIFFRFRSLVNHPRRRPLCVSEHNILSSTIGSPLLLCTTPPQHRGPSRNPIDDAAVRLRFFFLLLIIIIIVWRRTHTSIAGTIIGISRTYIYIYSYHKRRIILLWYIVYYIYA